MLFEQRGHGDSSMRAGRKVDYGFREHLEHDIPAALDWIDRELGTDDITLMGHSLGGHLTACTVALQPQRFSRVILAASGTPWLPTFSGAIRWQIRLLRLIIPPLNLLCGHFPGNVLGFGGREATTLMRDWCALAKDNRYHAQGMDVDFEAGMARFEGEVLRLCYDADTYAPVKAADAVADKFTGHGSRNACSNRTIWDSRPITSNGYDGQAARSRQSRTGWVATMWHRQTTRLKATGRARHERSISSLHGGAGSDCSTRIL